VSKVERLIDEGELQAYLGGRLDSERTAEIEVYLNRYPNTAERLQSYRRTRQELKHLLAEKLEEGIPERLCVSAIAARLHEA
jgi:anti-sigma factor RsiW